MGITVILVSIFLNTPLCEGQSGLDQRDPIAPFLNGVFPSETPSQTVNSSVTWRIENAFPNLVIPAPSPIQMVPVPGTSSQLLLATQDGKLFKFENSPTTTVPTEVLDLTPVTQSRGDSGVLGVAFHPKYTNGQPYLFVYYRAQPVGNQDPELGYRRLSRFTWTPGANSIVAASELILINQFDPSNTHNGGGMFFGADGFLYLSMGDRGFVNPQGETEQLIDEGLFGGVMRIDVDMDPVKSHPIRRQPTPSPGRPSEWIEENFTQNYYIPNDNPFVSPGGDVLEEYYAIGVRSPHRMTIDPISNEIWLGDVGGGAKEEINIVTKGANLQWPYYEGTKRRSIAAIPPNPPGIQTPPNFEYGRDLGGCVIGGYVYRGTANPELYGKYIFCEFNQGAVYFLEELPGGVYEPRLIGNVPPQLILGFGHDHNNEIYLLKRSGVEPTSILRIVTNSSPNNETPPLLLSDTNAFTNLNTLAPTSGLVPYDVIQPFWSDNAEKARWLAVPHGAGVVDNQIEFSETGNWDFPTGSVLVKHFELGGKRIETRFTIKGNDDWYGLTYRWNATETDANLVTGLRGTDIMVQTDQGNSLNWYIPSRTDCLTCHTQVKGRVLGVKTRHLNSDLTYPATGRTANQLLTLNELGYFSTQIDNSSFPNMLTMAAIDDPTKTLEKRVRSYLDINCSQCHSQGGGARAAFESDLTVPAFWQNMINATPIQNLGIVDGKVIFPGDETKSILYTRASSIEGCCAMPPLSKNQPDTTALVVINDWIQSLIADEVPPGDVDPESSTGDISPPSLTITRTNLQNILKIGPTEPVIGLKESEIQVINGSITSFSTSGLNSDIQVSPTNPAQRVFVSIPMDSFHDLSGNANSRAFSFSYIPNQNTENLLTNPSFENGLNGWQQVVQPGGVLQLNPNASEGSLAVELSDAQVVQTTTVIPNEIYTFTGRYFTINGATLNIGILFFDSSGILLESGSKRKNKGFSATYRDFSVVAKAPSNAGSVQVYAYGGASGTTVLDQLYLSTGGDIDDPQPENLFENGDFETGLGGWTQVQNNSNSLIQLTSNASSGSQALLLVEAMIHQTIDGVPGENYTFRGKYVTTGGIGVDVGLMFFDSAGNVILETIQRLDPQSTYSDFSLTGIAPVGTNRVTGFVYGGAGGTLTIDELSLSAGLSTIDPENLLQNGSFENDLDDWSAVIPSGANQPLIEFSDLASDGSKSVLLTESLVNQSVACIPGTLLVFTGDYFTTGTLGVDALLIFFDDQSNEILTIPKRLDNSANYDSFEISAIAPPLSVRVMAFVYAGRSGTVTIDNLKLKIKANETDQNLLRNPGYEAQLNHWSNYVPNPATSIIRNSSAAFSGSSAAELSEALIHQRTDAVAGATYTFTGKYYNTGSPGFIDTGILFFDENDVELAFSSNPVAPVTQYTDFATAAVAPSGTAKVLAYVWGGSGGSTFLDEMSLTEDNAVNPNAPTVTLSGSANGLAPFQVSVIFSEGVSGLTIDDFAVTNASISNLQLLNAQNYQISVQPQSAGLITIVLPANSTINLDQIGNAESNTLSAWTGSVGNLTSGTMVYEQSWTQQGVFITEDRQVLVEVPNLPGPLPVVILLHGTGGTAREMLDERFAYLDRSINIAPQGYANSWNDQNFSNPLQSTAPDTDLIRSILQELQTYDNVDNSNIAIVGFSNGSGLLNRLLIEPESNLFTSAVSISLQLSSDHYRDGQFWYDQNGGGDFNTPIVPISGKRLLTLHGELDEVVSYYGGLSDGLVLLDAEESTFRWAQAMGYNGSQLLSSQGDTSDGVTVKYSYLNDQVVHHRITGSSHNLIVPGNEAAATARIQAIVKDFLGQ